MEKEILLDYIAKRLGTECLSDLKFCKGKCYNIMHDLRKDVYALREWNEAITYIEGSDETFDSLDAVCSYLQCKALNGE